MSDADKLGELKTDLPQQEPWAITSCFSVAASQQHMGLGQQKAGVAGQQEQTYQVSPEQRDKWAKSALRVGVRAPEQYIVG